MTAAGVTVVGVGIDAVEIDRMRAALRRTPGLAARVFTERERALSTSRCGDLKAGGLAGRFAVKEAVAKAFGTGIRGFGFRDVEVLNDHLGKPYVVLHAGAATTAARLGVTDLQVAITTSRELALAQATAVGNTR